MLAVCLLPWLEPTHDRCEKVVCFVSFVCSVPSSRFIPPSHLSRRSHGRPHTGRRHHSPMALSPPATPATAQSIVSPQVSSSRESQEQRATRVCGTHEQSIAHCTQRTSNANEINDVLRPWSKALSPDLHSQYTLWSWYRFPRFVPRGDVTCLISSQFLIK